MNGQMQLTGHVASTVDEASLIIQHYPYLPSSFKSKGWTFIHE